jgi:hypothetical protein
MLRVDATCTMIHLQYGLVYFVHFAPLPESAAKSSSRVTLPGPLLPHLGGERPVPHTTPHKVCFDACRISED